MAELTENCSQVVVISGSPMIVCWHAHTALLKSFLIITFLFNESLFGFEDGGWFFCYKMYGRLHHICKKAFMFSLRIAVSWNNQVELEI